ncbi:MAG: hypothetical protein ACO35C_03940 [Pontimonas sp.]
MGVRAVEVEAMDGVHETVLDDENTSIGTDTVKFQVILPDSFRRGGQKVVRETAYLLGGTERSLVIGHDLSDVTRDIFDFRVHVSLVRVTIHIDIDRSVVSMTRNAYDTVLEALCMACCDEVLPDDALMDGSKCFDVSDIYLDRFDDDLIYTSSDLDSIYDFMV